MDLSKLPKLSNTGETNSAKTDAASNPAPPIDYAAPPARELIGGFAEAWISIAIGAILLFVFPNTIKYVCSPTQFEQNNQVTDANGNVIPYIQSTFFWADLGVTVFAAALLTEGILLAVARKVTLLYVALAVTIAAACFNVFVVVHIYHDFGFPIVCGFGVAICIYMALTQWRLITAMTRPM